MAQRHPTSRRRPAETSSAVTDDVFVAKVFELSVWSKKNSQTLILLGIVLAVLVGGGIYYLNYRSNLASQASVEIERIQQTLATGDIEAAKAQLAAYLERFGGTAQADEARLLLGQTHLATHQPEVAVQVLSEGVSLRSPMGVQAGMLLGKAYEEVGRLDDSIAQYLQVADAARMDFQRREALADAARVRSLAGDHAGAAGLYRQILESLEEGENVDVDERGLFELRLAEAELAANG
jgi:tetratricopeptide (TPR) repeat protein